MIKLVIVYTLSTVVALLLFYLSIYKGRRLKTTYFSYFILHIFIYVIGVAGEISSQQIWQAIVSNGLEYLGICFIAPYFLLAVCEYTNNSLKNKWLICSLFIIPTISAIMVITFPLNGGIFYDEFELINNLGMNYLKVDGSIYRDILYNYFVVLIVISIVILIRSFVKGDKNTRRKNSFLLAGMIIPFLVAIIYLLGLTPFGIDLTPLALFFMCIYYGYNILFKEVFIATRFARSQVLDNMREGYVLSDDDFNFLDANIIAKDIFPFLNDCEIGMSLRDFEEIPKIMISNTDETKMLEFCIVSNDGVSKFFNIYKSYFQKDKNNAFNCYMIYDVTDEVVAKQELEFVARHDNLTKIYNRSTFNKLCSNLFLENAKNRSTCAVAMVDIDFFKKINDTYGHLSGDKVIIRMVENINKNIRGNDVFARYGGEEFILFIEDVNKEDAFNIAEKLRLIIERDLVILDDLAINITISMGVSVYDRTKDDTLEHFIERADALLYNAKKTGRNKVVIG